MHEKYADVLESYLIPAEEGFGLELLKFVGKGIGKVAKAIGIFLGLNIALVGVLLFSSKVNSDRYKKRYNNPTEGEKLSRDNYNKTWLPKINEFAKMVADDIKEADKKLDIKKFMDIEQPKVPLNATMNGVPIYYLYNHYICSLDWSKCQYPDADGDDEGNPELVKEFSEKISQMKPYFNKWKSEAKKFSPYFDLEIEVEEPDDDYYYCWFNLTLKCKWLDKDSILKPGLPEFKG